MNTALIIGIVVAVIGCLAFAAAAVLQALGADEAMRQVLSGGEEHSLVATFAPGEVPTGWHLLGRCTAGAPAVLVDGAVPEVTGWDHFRG